MKPREIVAYVIAAVLVIGIGGGFVYVGLNFKNPSNTNIPPAPDLAHTGIVTLESGDVYLVNKNLLYHVCIVRGRESAEVIFDFSPYTGEKCLKFVVPDQVEVSYTVLHVGELFLQRHSNVFYLRYPDAWKIVQK